MLVKLKLIMYNFLFISNISIYVSTDSLGITVSEVSLDRYWFAILGPGHIIHWLLQGDSPGEGVESVLQPAPLLG